MGAIAQVRLSPEEYLEIDRKAVVKSEYHGGEMFPMVAANTTHGRIIYELSYVLRRELGQSGCWASVAPRVRISERNYVYPDIAVVCGAAEHHKATDDLLTNPVAVIEVLSESTRDYDYGGKFALYRELPSLRQYMLVSQTEARAEVFEKTEDGRWILDCATGLEASAKLTHLGISLPLAEIYHGIELPKDAR